MVGTSVKLPVAVRAGLDVSVIVNVPVPGWALGTFTNVMVVGVSAPALSDANGVGVFTERSAPLLVLNVIARLLEGPNVPPAALSVNDVDIPPLD